MGSEYTVRVQAVVCADDDGGNAANMSAAAFASRVEFVNEVFAAAGVRFAFDPVADYLALRNSLVNREFTLLEAPNAGPDAWDHLPAVDGSSHALARGNLARLYPGKLVIVVRHLVSLLEGDDGRWRVVCGARSVGASTNHLSVSATACAADVAHGIGQFLSGRHAVDAGITGASGAAGRTPADSTVLSPQQARRVRDALELGLRRDLIAVKPAHRLALSRGGAAAAGTVSEVGVAQVRAGRIVTAVRDAAGQLVLTVWDGSANGDALVRRGIASAGAVKRLAVCGAGMDKVVTASVTPADQVELIVWHVDESGAVSREGSVARDAPASDVAVTLLSSTRACTVLIGTAARHLDGSLGIDVWRVDADGSLRAQAGARDREINHAIGGIATPRLAIAGLDAGRFVTTVRDAGGQPKAILWHYDDEVRSVTRNGSAGSADALVGRIAGCGLRHDAMVLAYETEDRTLGLRVHGCDGGMIGVCADAVAMGAGELAVCALGTHMVVTSVAAGAHNELLHILWQVSPDGAHLTRIAHVETRSECTRIATCAIDRTQFVAVMRNATGQLELVTWRLLASLGVACTKDTTARLVDRAVRAGTVRDGAARTGAAREARLGTATVHFDHEALVHARAGPKRRRAG